MLCTREREREVRVTKRGIVRQFNSVFNTMPVEKETKR